MHQRYLSITKPQNKLLEANDGKRPRKSHFILNLLTSYKPFDSS